jgi:prepilin-type N-terminal cleavage/methylation domain-containing protein
MKQFKNNPETVAAKMNRGFSLIELLVVIAIIALLAAIIFPVFSTVRENGRQKSSLANLHDISTKLEQYKLDHKTYPSVLFGRAYPPGAPVAMDKAYEAALADGVADQYFDGLYPEYIRDVNSFKDGNNPTSDLTAVQPVTTLTMVPSSATPGIEGNVVPVTTSFYTADAYDMSPRVTGTNQIGTDYVSRYNTSWTDITTGGVAVGGLSDEQYRRQLRWQNPPANTYVTSTSYHVRFANKVLVLFQNGSAKNYDSSLFLQPGADSDVTPASGVSAAKFWLMTP